MGAAMASERVEDRILADYDVHASTYGDLAEKVSTLLSTMLHERGLLVHAVTHRCKSRGSLERKVRRPDKHYESLSEITDIAAVRVTTYFADDVELATRAIREGFVVDEANTIDKGAGIDPDRFGYRSVHFVARMTEARDALVEYRRFRELKFEVQVRSILQHAWAEIEHDLGYKADGGIPKSIKRRFARIAGLLELADDEFCAIRDLLAEYAKSVDEEIDQKPSEVLLDAVSLNALLSRKSSAARRLDEIVAKAAGAETTHKTSPAFISPYATRLAAVGISTVEELERRSKADAELVERLVAYWAPNGEIKSVHTGMGLFYLILVQWWRLREPAQVHAKVAQSGMSWGADDGRIVSRLLEFPG